MEQDGHGTGVAWNRTGMEQDWHGTGLAWNRTGMEKDWHGTGLAWNTSLPFNYKNNQQDALYRLILLFQVSSTCFGRCFRPSSGVLDCIYSSW